MGPDLTGRSVAIAGASGGVGEGVTRALLRHGARVIALGRDRTRLDRLTEHVTDADGVDRLVLHVADVSDADSAAVARSIRERHGQLDGVVICIGDPGRPVHGTALDIPDREWDAMIAGNQTAGFRALRALVPVTRRSGAVVTLLGYSAEIPLPSNPLMASTNAALRSLVQTLGVQLHDTGPRLHGLILGVVRTRARQRVGIDDPQWLTGEQVGDQVVRLLTNTVEEPDKTLHYLLDPDTGLTTTPSTIPTTR